MCALASLTHARTYLSVGSKARLRCLPSMPPSTGALQRRTTRFSLPIPTSFAGMKIYQTNCAGCHGDIHHSHAAFGDAFYPFKRASRNRNLYDLARQIRNQGMRPEEVMSLRKEDIDLERGQLQVRFGKTKAARRTLNLTAEGLSGFSCRRRAESASWTRCSPQRRIVSGRACRLGLEAGASVRPRRFWARRATSS
jgi:integrase